MKSLLLSTLFLTFALVGFSSNWIGIRSTTPTPAKIQLVSSSLDQSIVHFTVDGYFLKEVQTPHGLAFTVALDGATPILAAGNPDLPKLTTSLIIPDQAGMSVRVLTSSFTDYPNIEIAPSKGVLSRTIDPSTIPYTYGSAYTQNAFVPVGLTDVREPFIVRELRGQTVIVYPFQYNPVTKTLRVYHDLQVELYKSSNQGANPLTRNDSDVKLDQHFSAVYAHQFLNFDALTYTPLAEYGNMLVISYGQFMNDMLPFVQWKNQIGYATEMVDVATIGSSAAAIKSFIADYYTTKGLTFVLLVGDAAQIPTNTGGGLGGPSDNAYGYIVGNDHYADLFVGRFSAENVTHVQTQVQRTLTYERNPDSLAGDWFTSVIGIASDQGPGDDGEYDYQHIRNQQTQLLAYKYTWNPELFDGSQGGNDASGNPTPSQVATAVNDGASLILYCGHGSMTSWGTSGFSNNNVNNLVNNGKWPFIWSVACVNGQFNAGTCFAEAWLRATKNGSPTGAVAFLGSTINQSWNSPMEGQDEMTDIIAESYPDNIKRTFAGLSINGCFKMIQTYGTDGANMADTWTVFGDPTVAVRTATPEYMTVAHDSVILQGDSTLLVNCSVDGARVTATIHDSIIATTLVQGGLANLAFMPLQAEGDTIHIVVTAYNFIPYVSDAYVMTALAPQLFDFTGTPTTIIPGSSVVFSDSTSGYITQTHWFFPGGTPSESYDANPSVVYDLPGVYDVQLIVSNSKGGDTLTKAGYITADWPAGIDAKAAYQVSVAPNPSNGLVTVSLKGWGSENISLSVRNMLGTLVKSIEAVKDNQSVKVNLGDQPSGIYFLTIRGVNKSVVQKIVIK